MGSPRIRSERTQSWSNWFGNQHARPARFEQPTTEEAVQEAVVRAVDDNRSVRVVGGGHSLTPLVVTDGTLLDVRTGEDVPVDAETGLARVKAGQTVQDVADRLAESGVALHNVGELKAATLIGAASTGVHGTGVGLPCVAASVQAMRLVTARGDILEITESDTELLRAGRISLGMLGVITEMTFSTRPAYDLHERVFFCSPAELADRWDELAQSHRHLSFFYVPDAAAIPGYAGVVPQLITALAPDADGAALTAPQSGGTCIVSVRDIVDPAAAPPALGPGERIDSMDRILLYDFTEPYREIEMAVPYENSAQTFLDICDRLDSHHSSYDQPLLVRFVAEDDALLSWFHTGPRVIFSVTEKPSASYNGILADFEKFFEARGALPHWGKEHTLDARRLNRLQPGLSAFRAIRRELDPTGVFLNDHLRPLFE